MTLKNCEENCNDYHSIPHDTGITLYCAKFDAFLDEELIEKCDKMFERKSERGFYFVK